MYRHMVGNTIFQVEEKTTAGGLVGPLLLEVELEVVAQEEDGGEMHQPQPQHHLHSLSTLQFPLPEISPEGSNNH